MAFSAVRSMLSRILGSRTNTNRPARPKPVSLQVEALEKRDLMAVASPTLNAGVLRVVGDAGHDNIEIRETSTGPILLFSSGAASADSITVKDLTNDNSFAFNRSEVQRIEVDLGAGQNRLNSDAGVPLTVFGGPDNDFVELGPANDVVFGGGGNDTVTAGAGNDVVHGEDGNDVLYGLGGNDTITGGSGNNFLLGGENDDTLSSLSRTDSVDGHDGYDTLFLMAGSPSVHGGENVTIATPTDQPQTDNFSCGPNSGSRLLRAYGLDVSYAALRRKVKADSLLFKFRLGTRPSVLRKALAGFKSDLSLTTKSSLQEVLDHLSAGKPVIALIATRTKSLSIGGKYGIMHYVVVNGYDLDSQTIRYVDTNGAQKSFTFAEFDHHWKWFNHFTGVLGEGAQKVLEGLGLRKRTIIA